MQEQPKSDSLMGLNVLETLIYNAYNKQSDDNKPNFAGKDTVLFRNQWPPDFTPPADANTVYIHQQAWEFSGIPNNWVTSFNNATDEVWVPSEYNAKAFIDSGVQSDKVVVLKHGVEFSKFNLTVLPLRLPTKKSFRFLFNGGLLPRKGIDKLLEAYTSAFTRSDDVCLVIHSAYGDDFALEDVKKLSKDTHAPQVIFLQEDLSQIEMLRLYAAADVYVSPYRSEGFGLTILEAMAMGLQTIVTDFGPSKEICPADVPRACTFVQADPAECHIKPCGDNSLFGQDTPYQPMWSEPRVMSLKRKLLDAYQSRQNDLHAASTKDRIQQHAAQQTWHDVGTLMAQQIEMLLRAKARAYKSAEVEVSW